MVGGAGLLIRDQKWCWGRKRLTNAGLAIIAIALQRPYTTRISRNTLFAQGNWFRVRHIFSPMRKLTMKQSYKNYVLCCEQKLNNKAKERLLNSQERLQNCWHRS